MTAILTLSVVATVWAGDTNKAAAPLLSEGSKVPFKQPTETDGYMMLRVIGGLAVVILLGYGAVYTMKRYMPALSGHSITAQRRIHVLETRRLTLKATLFLVEVDGVHLLLAQSGDRITNLQQVSARGVTKQSDVDHAHDS